jgi:signal transduction histidine kinase
VIILFVALVPLSISAITTLRVHQRAYDDKLTEFHSKTADYGASLSSMSLDHAISSLAGLSKKSISWAVLSDTERGYALSLIYDQLDDTAIVSLLDDQGSGVGASIYVTESNATEGGPSHPVASVDLLNAFSRNIPFLEAKEHGVAVGSPYWPPGDDHPTVSLAFGVPGPDDGGVWVLAVAFSLRGVCAALERAKAPGTELRLADSDKRVLCGGTAKEFGTLAEALSSTLTEPVTVRYETGGKDSVAAIAPTQRGWRVVVEQPAASAFASSRSLRLRMIFWIVVGVIASVGAGLFLAQGISGPLRTLAVGASEIEHRNFDHELPADGGDEFADLSRAFNAMSAEIREWNAELHQRVEDRTRELKVAQEQLLESRKMAAVASLGAGVAHEINNPLTAVLSLSQILRARGAKDGMADKQLKILDRIEEGALRIHDIVKKMHGLSQSYGEGFKNHRPDVVVDAAIEAARGALDDAKVEVVRQYEDELPPVFANGEQLQEALGQLIDNSVRAMRGEVRRLTVTLASVEGELVKIEVEDTGAGIAPEHIGKVFEPFYTTKEEWSSRGLGLSVAHRIVTAHHGTIRADKDVEVGARMIITLPIARERAHLV